MYNAFGGKIYTISDATMLEELEKFAVKEIIVKSMNYPTKVSEENQVNQPIAHRSSAHNSPAKQPSAKFKPPANARAVVTLGLPKEDTHGPAAGRGAEKVGLYTIPARRPAQNWHQKTRTDLALEDQHQTWHQNFPDNTKIGLLGGTAPKIQEGGREPDPQVGGQRHGLQVGGQDHLQHVGGCDHDHKVGGPNHSSTGVEQVLQQVTQPSVDQLSTKAPKVSNTKGNRSLEGNHETIQAATEDKYEDQPEENLKEKSNVDDELLAILDEAEVEPDVAVNIQAAENRNKSWLQKSWMQKTHPSTSLLMRRTKSLMMTLKT